ncbi:MAG: L,D-transpeptidase family protein [Acidimicrobiales bacterium]
MIRFRPAVAAGLLLVIAVTAAIVTVPLVSGGSRAPATTSAGASTTTAPALSTATVRTEPAPTTAVTTSTTTAIAPPAPTTAVTTTTVTPRPPPPSQPGCPDTVASEMASRDHASQLITVVASDSGATYATLTAWKRSGSCWAVALGPFEARIGTAGISTDKHEGDGTTPAGVYDFEPTMYGIAANPGVRFTYRRLSCGDWWDEDSASPEYNRFVVVPCSETHPPFDNGASEPLWTETVAYPSLAVINYNPNDIPGKGSAIFLHADIGIATTGCVTIPLGELDEVLDWMLPADDPAIAIGTTATITSY